MIRQKDILVVLLLTILTCGLYSLFWIYDTGLQLKQRLNTPDSPGLDLLLCLICFPYVYFWYYKTSKQVAAAEAAAGLPVSDNAVLNLLLVFFGLGIVSILIIQGQLNAIAAKEGTC